MKKLTLFVSSLGGTLLAAAPVSLHWSPQKTLSFSLDEAATTTLDAGSVTSINRRVHRRAYSTAVAAADRRQRLEPPL